MADITVQILENIRGDIAAMDRKFDGKLDAMDRKFDGKLDALDRRLTTRLDQTNERLGSIVTLMGHFVRREDDIDSRLRALEAHVFGRPES